MRNLMLLVGVFAAGVFAGPHLGVVQAQAGPKVYELRTYTAPEGKLADLHARFRNHTLRIFQKHGMTNVVYLAPTDAPLSQNTLVYLLAHQSRDAAKASWDAFRNDPEWKKLSATPGYTDPEIVSNITSIYLRPAAYSQV